MDHKEKSSPAPPSRLGYAGLAATGPLQGAGGALQAPPQSVCGHLRRRLLCPRNPGRGQGLSSGARGPRSPPGPPRLPACPWRRAPRSPAAPPPPRLCGRPGTQTPRYCPLRARGRTRGNAAPRREGDAREPAGGAPGEARRPARPPLSAQPGARGSGPRLGQGSGAWARSPRAPGGAAPRHPPATRGLGGQHARRPPGSAPRAPAAAPRAHLPGSLFA